MIDIVEAIDRACALSKDPARPYIGASTLGNPCERYLWLRFRFVLPDTVEPRIKRLFKRGHNEESVVIGYLRDAGFEVTHCLDEQKNLEFGGFVRGSPDGIVNGEYLLEIKTHSLSSFTALKKSGVEKYKPMHYTQMQLYMQGTGLQKAIYYAVCKNDDEIYTEIVQYDKDHASRAIAKGIRLSLEERMPPPISDNPSWYQCKTCSMRSLCHPKTYKD